MANETDFYIKEGDVEPSLKVELQNDDGTSVDLTDARVSFSMKEVGGDTFTVELNESSIVSPSDGRVNYKWCTTDTESSGYYNAVFGAEYDAVESTQETLTYSSGTDIYSLSNEGIILQGYYDVSVSDASDDEYEIDSDYAIIDDSNGGSLDSIDWGVGGSSPDDGEDFTIEYSYRITEDISPDETFPNSQYITIRVDESL